MIAPVDLKLNSQILYFLDEKQSFAWCFVEGQDLILNAAISQSIDANALALLREFLLGFLTFQSFMKPNEMRGLYIDSKDPELFLKLEMSSEGLLRYVIAPKVLATEVEKISGFARMTIVSGRDKTPYTSVIEIKNMNVNMIINEMLSQSEQKASKVFISSRVDQSIFIQKLPSSHKDHMSLNAYLLQQQKLIYDLNNTVFSDGDAIKAALEKSGLRFLEKRTLAMKCGCSIQQMVSHLRLLNEENLFAEQSELEVVCEYCNKIYHIREVDLAADAH